MDGTAHLMMLAFRLGAVCEDAGRGVTAIDVDEARRAGVVECPRFGRGLAEAQYARGSHDHAIGSAQLEQQTLDLPIVRSLDFVGVAEADHGAAVRHQRESFAIQRRPVGASAEVLDPNLPRIQIQHVARVIVRVETRPL